MGSPTMALRRCKGGWVTHLSLLVTCLLLITGGARGSEGEDMALEGGGEEEGSADGTGGEGRVMENTVDAEDVVVVENGTAEAVVLDCPYHLDEEDQAGVHINWYHPRIFGPVYQWIPVNGPPPQAMWILEDRVDLTYEASQEPLHRHRALRILNPTTELSARYTCRVSTYTADLSYTKDLIVFREPSALDVWVEERPEGKVAVSCRVEEIYPQPVLHLYQKSSSKDSEILRGGTPVTSFEGKTYNMEVEKVVEEETLDGPTDFECHVTIPNTKVRRTTSTKYQPRVSVTTGAMTTGSSMQQPSAVLLAVFSVLVCWLHD